MKIYFYILCLVSIMIQKAIAQKNNQGSNHKKEKNFENPDNFPDYDNSLLLEMKSDNNGKC